MTSLTLEQRLRRLASLTNRRFHSTTPSTLAALKRDYPDAPEDYVQFLRVVGWGQFGEYGDFMVYSFFADPEAVFGDAEDLEDVLLVGDDFQGFCFGYRLPGWELVEVSPGREVELLGQTFVEFLEWLLDSDEEA